MRRRGILFNHSGFTLAEILVAMSVLLIIMVAAIPLFVYIAEAAQANKVRLEATRIAGSEIERIRALPYSQVGNIGGNPPGVIQRDRVVALNGVNFTVTTDVWWWDDESDALGGAAGAGTDPIPYDYKRVKVSVSAPGLFGGDVTMYLDLDTLATLEGEEEAFPGGNIRLMAQRGWKRGADETPVEGAMVRLTAGPDAPQTLWTDDFGRTLFAILAEGAYTVVFTAPAGMIVRPDQLSFDASVTTGVTSELIVEAEYPVRISLSLRDISTGDPLAAAGTVILVRPYGGEQPFPFTSDPDGLIGDIFGDLWPVGGAPFGHPGAYSLKIQGVDGYMTYDMAVVPAAEKPRLPNGDPWDGTFVAPNTRLDLIVYLRPLFYREPQPVPFQPAAHFENLAVTGGNELVIGSTVAEQDFRLSTVYAATAGPDRSRYRGYRFRVDTALTVTHLIGGGDEPGFRGAIYQASGNRPVELLGSVSFTGNTRHQFVVLPAPVLLVPGTDYIIAQGRASGGGEHYRVASIGDDLINSATHLADWFPADGDALEWGITDDIPSAIVDRDPVDLSDSDRPDLGFRYQAAGFHPTGSKISLPIDLSAFTAAPALRVHWEADTPTGTSIAVAATNTGSTALPAPADFAAVTNGAAIPGITPGDNLAHRYLWLRVTLTSSADRTRTPLLRRLSVEY